MKKDRIIIHKSVVLGKNVKIETNVQILGECMVGDNCVLKSGTVLEDVVLGDGCLVENSKITKANLGKNVKVGPFAHIRPNCIVADEVKIGSFVEIKNTYIGKGSKIPHLAYVGDAEIGENVNVGCGVVFANYDGKEKHHTRVGNNVFIGCNVNIVAPVNIADNTYICAGTTVTKDTQFGDFVIGRVRQENRQR
ncbi:MAG: DapH/DapD/GlmU-related protein [Candidatus Caccovivens sp.]